MPGSASGFAGERLDERAGQAERNADHDGQQGARTPELPHDQIGGAAGILLPRGPPIGDRTIARPDEGAGHREQAHTDRNGERPAPTADPHTGHGRRQDRGTGRLALVMSRGEELAGIPAA